MGDMADFLSDVHENDQLSAQDKAELQVSYENVWGKARNQALRKGYDHGYAAYAADLAEKRAILKWSRHFEKR